MKDCVFCKIVNGEIPTKLELMTDNAIAFRDIKPSAQLHLIIIPKKHITNILELNNKGADLLSELYDVGRKLIQKYKPKKFRFIINGGNYLEVDHLHLHLLGGKLLDWAKEDLFDDN